ncbi:MAG: hypothetical protein GY750_04680 [Lentisphaerae bacterium]|nr:hypothetical protein [Lentisphaerota bacterium]MCP4100707.1 hypothetical protein [Lentisphaerota bacterium]
MLNNTPPNKQYDPKVNYAYVCDICVKSPRVLYIEDDFSKDTPQVQDIALLAKKTIISANASFPVSSSRMGYYQDYNKELFPTQAEQTKHRGIVSSIMRQPQKFTDRIPVSKTVFDMLENKVSHCLKYSVANCHEMSKFCYLFFHYAATRRQIVIKDAELCYLPYGDHIFLLITPSENHVPRKEFAAADRKIQLLNTIVCDPWLKSLFYLKNYHKYIGTHILKKNDISHVRYKKLRRYYKLGNPNIEQYLV